MSFKAGSRGEVHAVCNLSWRESIILRKGNLKTGSQGQSQAKYRRSEEQEVEEGFIIQIDSSLRLSLLQTEVYNCDLTVAPS